MLITTYFLVAGFPG